MYPALLTNPALTITKCERDMGFIIDAVVKDLRVGGNINTVYAAESYISGGNVSYVDGELTETLLAYDHLRRLAFGAIRNFNLLIKNCSTTSGSATVTVGDTSGLVPGMNVSHYDQSDFTNGKLNENSTRLGTLLDSNSPVIIDEIVNATTITIKDVNTGQPFNANGDSTTAWLYFENVSNGVEDCADGSDEGSAFYMTCLLYTSPSPRD